MTKATWKTGVTLLVAAVLALGMMGMLPGTATEANAVAKPYMKTLKLNWDLKKNKTVKSKQRFVGLGLKALNITVKNYKTTELENGKKKTSFTLVYSQPFKPSKKQVHKIARPKSDVLRTGVFYAIVDYNTGKSLENKSELAKELGVKVKHGEWKNSPVKMYRDNDGCWVSFYAKDTVKVSITYPADYTGLCLGVGGDSYFADHLPAKTYAAYEKFWDGEKPLGKTPIYKKDRTTSHWMHIE